VAATISNRALGRRRADYAASRSLFGLYLLLAVYMLSSLGCAQIEPAISPVKPKASAAEAAELPLSGSTNVIYVVPIDGIGGPLRLVLADAVAASLRDSERPAVLAGKVNDRGPSIVGKIAGVRTRGSIVWVTTTWSLRAPFGTVVAQRTREIVVDKSYWDRNSVEVVNLIVGDAMPAVAAMVQDYVGPLHVAQTVVEEPRATDIRGIDPTPSTPPAPALQPEMPELPDTMAAETSVIASDRTAAETIVAATAPSEPGPALPDPVNSTAAAARPPMALTPKTAQQAASLPPRVDGLTAEEIAAVPEGSVRVAASAPAGDSSPSPETGTLKMSASKPEPPTAREGIVASPGDTPVVWGRPSFLIRAVKGAPGDGNTALNDALRAALHGKDLTVTDDPRQAGYEVVGTVNVGPPVNGRQRARIAWVVNTISGEEVGKAVQENVIAAGSLNRSWGRVAKIVTAAAADGIQQLFEAPRPKYTPVGAVPEFPKVPVLPRVPGRALPPPPS